MLLHLDTAYVYECMKRGSVSRCHVPREKRTLIDPPSCCQSVYGSKMQRVWRMFRSRPWTGVRRRRLECFRHGNAIGEQASSVADSQAGKRSAMPVEKRVVSVTGFEELGTEVWELDAIDSAPEVHILIIPGNPGSAGIISCSLGTQHLVCSYVC